MTRPSVVMSYETNEMHKGLQKSCEGWIFSRRTREAFAALDARQIDARQQHREFTGFQFHAHPRLLGSRQTKRAFFQTLVPDREPVGVPVQDLETISTTAGEQEQMTGQWIVPQRLADQRRQGVKALAHVRGRSAQVDANA